MKAVFAFMSLGSLAACFYIAHTHGLWWTLLLCFLFALSYRAGDKL